MTVKEWREQNPETGCFMYYAADAGSFGPKGGSVYGSREVTARFEIILISSCRLSCPQPHDVPVLYVWDPIVCRGPRPLPEEALA